MQQIGEFLAYPMSDISQAINNEQFGSARPLDGKMRS